MNFYEIKVIHRGGRSAWNIIAPSSIRAADIALGLDTRVFNQNQSFALISKPKTKGGSDE